VRDYLGTALLVGMDVLRLGHACWWVDALDSQQRALGLLSRLPETHALTSARIVNFLVAALHGRVSSR
jgi:hypothetical protein